jgi:hypothetical protein
VVALGGNRGLEEVSDFLAADADNEFAMIESTIHAPISPKLSIGLLLV